MSLCDVPSSLFNLCYCNFHEFDVLITGIYESSLSLNDFAFD